MKSEWERKTIGEVCTLVTDGSHFSPQSVDKGRFMVSVKDFTPFGFDFSNCRQISEEDYVLLEKSGCVPEIDDVLVGKDGARFFEDIIIYRQAERPALLSSIAILRCNSKIVIPEFLLYTLKSPTFKRVVRDNYGSGSAIPRIVLKDFKRMPIYCPSLSIQRTITNSLSALDAKIVNNSKIRHHLEHMAQAIFKSWFVDFEPWGGVMPDDWREGTLSDIAASVYSGGTPNTGAASYWDGDIPWLSSGETRNHFITTTEKSITQSGVDNSSTRLAHRFDVVMASAGQGLTRGQTSLLLFDSYVNQSIIVMHGNNPIYLFLNLSGRYEELRAISDTSSIRGSITTKMLAQFPMLLPSRASLNDFSNAVKPLFGQIENNLRETALLTELRDTLLPRLMSGELSVSDLSDTN